MTRPTIGMKLADNRFGWTRPWNRREGASFVWDHAYAAEDWNFAVDQAIDGWVYGFTQGVPSEERHDWEPVDLLFYVYEPGGVYRAVGLYLGAELLSDEDAGQVARSKGWKKVRKARRDQIFAAYGPGDWKRVWKHYKSETAPFNWRVRVEDVITFDERPAFSPPYRATRDGTPYYFDGRSWEALLDVPAEDGDSETTIEGRVRLARHRRRERDPNRAARVKNKRLAQVGKLACDGCGFDYGTRFGDRFGTLLEAHHTLPLSELSHLGEAVSDDDIALLCPNCHRLAHRSGHTDLPTLQAFLARHGTTP